MTPKRDRGQVVRSRVAAASAASSASQSSIVDPNGTATSFEKPTAMKPSSVRRSASWPMGTA